MTRVYIAKRLLEHGPLTAREFTEITGWPSRQALNALRALVKTGSALRLGGQRHYRYRLAA